MRKLHSLIIGGLCACVASYAAVAEDYPTKAISAVVGYPPGGGTDIAARLVSEELSKQLGATVLVDNRPGASGIVALSYVAQAEPDGYTLMFGASTAMVIAKAIGREMPNDPLTDVVPVSLVSEVPYVLVVNPEVPADSVQALISLAKERPGEINFATFGQGTSNHLITEMFKRRTGIDAVHVPFSGAAPATTALLGGEVHFAFDTLSVILPHVKAGKLKALAVADEKRSPLMPDVPTMAEAGVEGVIGGSWVGLFAPANTPKTIIDRLSREVASAVQTPAVTEGLMKLGNAPVGSTPDELAAFLEAEIKKWTGVAKEIGM